jgi:hypothetical protein
MCHLPVILALKCFVTNLDVTWHRPVFEPQPLNGLGWVKQQQDRAKFCIWGRGDRFSLKKMYEKDESSSDLRRTKKELLI